MAISAENLVPRLVLAAVAGYCVWPSLTELMSTPREKPPDKPPELASSLLSPKLPPLTKRNLFKSSVAATAAAPNQSPLSSAFNHVAKAVEKPSPSAASKRGVSKKPDANAKSTTKPPEKTVDPLSGLTLNATCILGDKRLAMINGRMYAPQDKISEGKSSSTPCRLVSVDPYKVVLEYEGKKVELKYSDLSSKSAAASDAKSKGAAKPSTAKAKNSSLSFLSPKSAGSSKKDQTEK